MIRREHRYSYAKATVVWQQRCYIVFLRFAEKLLMSRGRHKRNPVEVYATEKTSQYLTNILDRPSLLFVRCLAQYFVEAVVSLHILRILPGSGRHVINGEQSRFLCKLRVNHAANIRATRKCSNAPPHDYSARLCYIRCFSVWISTNAHIPCPRAHKIRRGTRCSRESLAPAQGGWEVGRLNT